MNAIDAIFGAAGIRQAFFAVDLLAIGAAGWLIACGSGHGRQGAVEAMVAWIWSVVALVAAAGTALGVLGGFGPTGFGLSHVMLLALTLLWRRRHLRADADALRELLRRVREGPGAERSSKLIAASLGLIVAALAVLAFAGEPTVMDALNYHLPRIGHWLQEGRIRMIAEGDERLDYIAGLPEIVMAWLVGAFPTGFRGTVFLQALGGTLAVLATVGMARMSGLRQTAAWLAGGLLLGMANVAAQFTAAQTDLFTAGVFAAAFFLWAVALQRGQLSVPGTLGAGLALGAKGTVFYLAPAALLWMIWLAHQNRRGWRYWSGALAVGIVGIVLFAGPALWRNWRAYGDVRGPAHWIQEFHPALPSLRARAAKLRINSISFLAQNFDPQSQPDGVRSLSREMGEALVATLPATDPYTFLGQSRREGLKRVLGRTSPDADMLAFGVPVLVLLLSGGLLSVMKCRKHPARLILVWGAGVWGFLIFFNLLHEWHPFSFRYYVLIAPWIAVVGAWGIEQAGALWRKVLWLILVACTLNVGWRVTVETHQAGWQSVAHPERTLGGHIARGWREWSQQLDRPEGSFLIGLPDDRPLAAFYRQEPRRRVQLVSGATLDRATSVEEFLRGRKDWVIMSASRFIGREGRVIGNPWLFRGDENDPYSLVAYRLPGPGEQPGPFLYRQRWTTGNNTLRREMLVKTFEEDTIRLALTNPGTEIQSYSWFTPLHSGRGEIPAGSRVELVVTVPRNAVVEVRIEFGSDPGDASRRPQVNLGY